MTTLLSANDPAADANPSATSPAATAMLADILSTPRRQEPATRTRHLIGAAELLRMKKGALLINSARGPIVDEAALAAALQAGHLGGAALDVYENEPRVHPGLIGRDDVVLLPHLGSATRETRQAMGRLALTDVELVLRGERPAHPVNEVAGK